MATAPTFPCAALFLILLALIAASASADRTVKPDSGKFTITLQEASAGSETFSIAANGSSKYDETILLGGNKTLIHSSVKVINGKLTEIRTEGSQQGKSLGSAVITIQGTKGTMTIGKQPGKAITLPANALPFGNFAPHLLSYLVAAYDVKRGGAQKITLLLTEAITPQGPPAVHGTIDAKGSRQQTVGGKSIQISRYALVLAGRTGDIDTELLTDADGRVLLFRVPGQKLDEVRDGYQELTK